MQSRLHASVMEKPAKTGSGFPPRNLAVNRAQYAACRIALRLPGITGGPRLATPCCGTAPKDGLCSSGSTHSGPGEPSMPLLPERDRLRRLASQVPVLAWQREDLRSTTPDHNRTLLENPRQNTPSRRSANRTSTPFPGDDRQAAPARPEADLANSTDTPRSKT